MHKHLQALRGPPHAFDFLTLMTMGDKKQHGAAGTATAEKKSPFQFFMHHFQNGFSNTPAEELLHVYDTLLEKSRLVLGIDEIYVVPHNMVLWDNRIVVIPRSRGISDGLSTNTAGMMGSIWVPEQKDVNEWLGKGCANVMKGLGVPA